jgi:hypothetical protein
VAISKHSERISSSGEEHVVIDDTILAHVLKVWWLQSRRHFQGGEWNENGSCSSATILNDNQVKDLALPTFLFISQALNFQLSPLHLASIRAIV